MCDKCQRTQPKLRTKLTSQVKLTAKTARNRGSSGAVCVSGEAVAKPLGNTAESSTTSHHISGDSAVFSGAVVRSARKVQGESPSYDHRTARAERYRTQGIIADLLMREGQRMQLKYADDYHRTAQCLRKPYASGVSVNKSKTYNVAFYAHIQRCANPWACPVCSATIQEVRRKEIAQAFDYTYKMMTGKKVIMVTFTFPHTIADRLKDQINGLTKAFQHLRAGNVWTLMKKRIGFEGLIRSLEVMYGENGWHSHTHEAWIVDKGVNVGELRDWLTKRWFDMCVKAGLIETDYKKTDSFNAHAVQITDNCKSSDYLAKHGGGYWGADRELAKANNKGTKHSDKTTIHPFDLIRKLEEHGEAIYGDLFVEYVDAMRGKAQVFWSHGLKAKVGIKDKTDQEIVEAKEDKADVLALLTNDDWRLVRAKKVRAELLDVAEKNGYEGIVRFLEVLRE